MTGNPSTRARRIALRLEYATIAWNVGEAFVTIGLGIAAASLALVGFGADSIIEVFASSVVVWHLRPFDGEARSPDVERTDRALRLVAVAFGALAAVLATVAIRDLATGRRPGESPWGIAYLAVTAVVMLALAALKFRTAAEIGSPPLRSEATMTLLDGMLAAATVAGLVLHAAAGWWWADPAAALLVSVAAGREAVENWQEAAR